MDQLIPLIVPVLAFVLLAMLGLGLGVLLKKKTPLKGSCRGPTCEVHGEESEAQGGCRCAAEAQRSQRDHRPR